MGIQKKSKEYKYLEKRIKQIKKNFSFNQSINGITSLQADRLRGLIVLCHAEFEDYFESIALSLLSKAETLWDEKKVANYNLAALFMWHEKFEKNRYNYETHARKIIADYKEEVRNNHGIKDENIKKMFGPLGYKIDDFDVSFISTLSSFGTKRGETAHISAKRTQESLDQRTEIDRIDYLLENIESFEETIFSK